MNITIQHAGLTVLTTERGSSIIAALHERFTGDMKVTVEKLDDPEQWTLQFSQHVTDFDGNESVSVVKVYVFDPKVLHDLAGAIEHVMLQPDGS